MKTTKKQIKFRQHKNKFDFIKYKNDTMSTIKDLRNKIRQAENVDDDKKVKKLKCKVS